MAELTTVARPYAKAAFQHALAANTLAEWSDTLASAAAVSQDAKFAAAIDSPVLTPLQQAELFTKVLGDKVDASARNFVTLLAQNDRLEALPAIASLYELYRADHEKSIDVCVTSAFEVTEQQSKTFADALENKLGRKISIETELDKSLIGGVIIQAGDLVIDASVRGKLSSLADTLNS